MPTGVCSRRPGRDKGKSKMWCFLVGNRLIGPSGLMTWMCYVASARELCEKYRANVLSRFFYDCSPVEDCSRANFWHWMLS